MSILLLLALTAGQSGQSPLSLDGLTLKQAEQLDGRRVAVHFTVGTPAYTWQRGRSTFTVVGPTDHGDGGEWSVVVSGNRLVELDEGTRFELVGRLGVIHHPAAAVGSELVEAWIEVRVEEE